MESKPRTTASSGSATLSERIIGPPRNVRDPGIFRSLSLIAFLAWVGLGSDGLSSSCYGPEESFLALGPHQYLAIFLALLTALTVFVISASYTQTIDLFPSGGGGYLVATKLLGPGAGVVSGCALVIDYVLTISVSIASGADAIFSFLPVSILWLRFWVCLLVVLVMVGMNLRGVKESVISLLPVFLAFVIMHVWLLSYIFLSRATKLPSIFGAAVHDARGGIDTLGLIAMAVIFFRAYSMGAGTYTGIEAVSNGLPILREPRTVTGKHTMIYMAFSLAFIAGGILVGYLLENVTKVEGMTLNAVMFQKATSHWNLGGIPVGGPITTLTLVTEGALLFVAAQTGFIDGPRVLATMATDRWLPRRLAHLSGRLVTQDGVIAMGGAAILILFGTHARVGLLVILYAINVFITFTLSQLGMSVHWWRVRDTESRWKRKLAVNGVGCVFTFSILMLTLTLKFDEGGWVTVLITGALISVCFLVRGHYNRFAAALRQLEADVTPLLYEAKRERAREPDPGAPTAGILVDGFNGLGLATLLTLTRLFPDEFKNVVFIGVGEVDSALLKGPKEVKELEQRVADDLNEYCQFASDLGLHASFKFAIGPDVVLEVVRLCGELTHQHPHLVFFAGKLIFSDEAEGYLGRFLHMHTALEVQRYLQIEGLSLVILPVRVTPPEPQPLPPAKPSAPRPSLP